jgi:uncharacterized membrane protein YwzB
MKKNINLLIECFILSCLLPLTLLTWKEYLITKGKGTIAHNLFLFMSIILTTLVLTRFIQIIKNHLKED